MLDIYAGIIKLNSTFKLPTMEKQNKTKAKT